MCSDDNVYFVSKETPWLVEVGLEDFLKKSALPDGALTGQAYGFALIDGKHGVLTTSEGAYSVSLDPLELGDAFFEGRGLGGDVAVKDGRVFLTASAGEGDVVKVYDASTLDDKIPAIELNISCPNVKQGGMAFGVTAKGAEEVVKAVRAAYKKTLIVKLSPNVTSIAEIARAVENGGADSVSLINTLLGMAIDAERRRPILSTVTGGMSGAAVKPIALRMVWQVAQAVKIPVIGLGGIMNWKDAVEFMLAGASAIQIGTANFIDPAVTIKVAEGINDYLDRHGYKSVKEIIGALEV